jgi:hypothetical protein
MITIELFMGRNLTIFHITPEESGTIRFRFLCILQRFVLSHTEGLVLPKVFSFSIMLHTPCLSNPGVRFPIL